MSTSSSPQPADARGAFGELLASWRRKRRHKVAVAVHAARDLPCMWVDAIQIEQVVLNLLLNAVEAMEGTSGEKIFEAFFTTKPQGLGMGLAISRSIMQAHGGRLWATANSDGGATFRFALPTAEPEGAAAPPAA